MPGTPDSLLSSTSPPPDLDDLIPLPHVGRALVEGGYSSRPVPYGPIWRAVTSGEIPTEPIVGNRMGVQRSNLGVVASVLKLTSTRKPAKPARTRRAAALEHAAP